VKPALLLIDLQRDYLDAPGLEPAADEIVRGAAALLDGCRARGIPALHVRTTVSPGGEDRMPHWRRAGITRCVEGTPGHRAPPELGERDETVIRKAWFSPFTDPELERALKRVEATDLVLAGVHLHGCVRATALDAYQRGLRVWIATDAVGSYDRLHAAVSARYLDGRAATLLRGAEILERLDREGERAR
jgi:nicotinamidase-related amidase